MKQINLGIRRVRGWLHRPVRPLRENGNERLKKVRRIAESPPQESSSRLRDADLLLWMLECPHGLDGLAKTSHEEDRLRESLRPWKAADRLDPEHQREKSALADAQAPLTTRVKSDNRSSNRSNENYTNFFVQRDTR